MAKVEEITDSNTLEEITEPDNTAPGIPTEDPEASQGGAKPNRGEKKCRKAMQKLGLKQVSGINRVTMKRSKNILFTIEQPEIFKSPNAEIYVVFGAAKYEDLNQVAANIEADKLKEKAPEKREEPAIETIKEEDEDEGGESDESGLRPEDIENVMSHCSISRAKAVKALRESDNDPIDAILKFS